MKKNPSSESRGRSSCKLLRYAFAVVLFWVATLALYAVSGVDTTQQAAFPEIFIVNSTGDGDDAVPGDGQCETAVGNGVCTLRAAIEEANAHAGGDGIGFSIPTSDPFCDPASGMCTIFLGNKRALPNISDSVNINGPGADKLNVQNAIGIPFFLFNVTTTGTVNLSGLTIGGTANNGASLGGGIQNSGTGTVNITSCVITDIFTSSNTTNGGAGIHNGSGIVNVTSSTISGNSASAPGYAYGSAIFNDSGTVTVTNSRLTNNSTIGGCGGGIYVRAGTVNVVSSELSGNFAGSDSSGFSFGGGAICNNGGTVNVTNSTLSGNGAFNTSTGHGLIGGGGILNGGTVNVTNSTISGNAIYGTNDFGGGGGILNLSPGVMNVKSSIIALNTGSPGPDVAGTFASKGFNLIGKKDGSTGFTAATDKKGTIASPLNPKLDWKGLRDNGGPTQTIALLSGSPAIDKGTSAGLTGTLTTDQRGFSRTVDNSSIPNPPGGDGTDIGAFEFGAQ